MGDPLLGPLRRLVRWVVKNLPVGTRLRYRLLLVDLTAPHHRAALPAQGDWHVVERGPPVFHRLRRAAAAILRRVLPRRSATPPGRDAGWYPAVLPVYGAYLAADEAGARPAVSWRPWRRLLEEEFLRRLQAGDPSVGAYRGAVVLAELALTHGNARSLRLLSIPARSRSRLPLRAALAAELYLEDTAWFDRAAGRGVYLPADSPWRLPAVYVPPLPSPPWTGGPPDLRLVVNSETYADPAGCGGCPGRRGTMAQWAAHLRGLDRDGVPTLRLAAGDWTPFFLEEDLSPGAWAARVRLAALAAARAELTALVVGPGEVAWGGERLRRLGQVAGTPLLTANVTLPGATPWRPFLVRRVGKLLVGIVGVTDLPRRRYRPSWFAEALRDVTLAEPVAAARRAARAARAAGAEFVVVVGALDPVHARLLAAAAEEVDLVISSAPGFDRPPRRGRGPFTAHDRSGFHGSVPVLYVTGGRAGVHRFEVRLVRRAGRVRVAAFRDREEHLAAGAPADPAVAAAAAEYRRRYGDGRP